MKTTLIIFLIGFLTILLNSNRCLAFTSTGEDTKYTPAGSNLGIGTTAPTATVDIGGGTKNYIDGTDDLLIENSLEIDGTFYTTSIRNSTINNSTYKVVLRNGFNMSTSAGSGKVLTSNGGGLVSWQSSGGGGQWDDGGSYLNPKVQGSAPNSKTVIIGSDNYNDADFIFYNGNGSIVFNEQGKNSDLSLKTPTTNYMLYVNGNDDSVSFNTVNTQGLALSIGGNFMLDNGDNRVHLHTFSPGLIGMDAGQLNKTYIQVSGYCYAPDMTYPNGLAMNVTSDMNPQIPDGQDGQVIILVGILDDASITYVHGNGLSLAGGQNITLSSGDVVVLMYDETLDNWIEISRSDNDLSGISCEDLGYGF